MIILPEQRTLQVRDPSELRATPVPSTPPPPTVSDPQAGAPKRLMSLDDVLRISLQNSAVVRVLAGVTAVSSGQTVYDATISNTFIDQQRARFDPALTAQNTFNRIETPTGVLDPLDPLNVQIFGTRTDNFNLNMGLTQTNIAGGTTTFGVVQTPARFQGLVNPLTPLNPQNTPQLALGYTQPLLQGAGVATNVAPIVIARLDTERSYFQFKDSMQDMVRGVIEAYWNVVFARTDVWAREQQVEQGRAAYERAAGRLKAGIGNAAQVAQTKVAWANFRATLIGSQANLLQREAALLNILGLPPTETPRFVPVTFPSTDRVQPDWNAVVNLAAERRPDLVELKIIIEADQQQLILANNLALPQANAIMQYSWNGLTGRTPGGQFVTTGLGQYTDWTLGVNFSLPLGLRQGRAVMRQRELTIARDNMNLQQGLHATTHILAGNLRNLARDYDQYLAYKETRVAARYNLEQQLAENNAGRAIFLNVLQAITDWGNAVSNEANALATYNTDLANLERETGTILETHGIRFIEERYGAIGPLGRLAVPQMYPERLPPTPNADRYPSGAEPAENSFDLKNPPILRRNRPPAETLPTPPASEALPPVSTAR